MKKLLVLALICVATATVQAQTNTSTNTMATAKAAKADLLAKYDLNHDGKLDKDEISKMTVEDKAAWKKMPHHKKKEADDAMSSTNSVTK